MYKVKIIFALYLLLLFIYSCSEDKSETVTDYRTVNSKNLTTPEERISKLKNYFHLRGNTLDAEFDIFDVNIGASRSIPGASSRDYNVVLLLDANETNLWKEDVTESTSPLDYSWAEDLVKNNQNFSTTGTPEFYTSPNKEVTIFNETGTVLIKIVQN